MPTNPATLPMIDAMLDTARKTLAIAERFPQLAPMATDLRESIADLERERIQHDPGLTAFQRKMARYGLPPGEG